jgi:hypothetical protein
VPDQFAAVDELDAEAGARAVLRRAPAADDLDHVGLGQGLRPALLQHRPFRRVVPTGEHGQILFAGRAEAHPLADEQ